jgi:hypothetical protein
MENIYKDGNFKKNIVSYEKLKLSLGGRLDLAGIISKSQYIMVPDQDHLCLDHKYISVGGVNDAALPHTDPGRAALCPQQ